jgi:hypothetical protein
MQGYTPGTPAASSAAVSQLMRDNFAALLDNHAGSSLPAYAVEGQFFYDTDTKRHYAVKPRGTKPFINVDMGSGVSLFVSMRENGLDGTTVASDVRVQDSTLLPSNHDFTNVPAQKIYFKSTHTLSFYAANYWGSDLIDDPVILSADGILNGKHWETLLPGTHETIYSTGTFSNASNFASSTLRAVGMMDDSTTFEFRFQAPGGIDHLSLTDSRLHWHDIQDDTAGPSIVQDGRAILLENGVEMNPLHYRVKPYASGGEIYLAVYHINPNDLIHVSAFDANSRYTLRIRKPS